MFLDFDTRNKFVEAQVRSLSHLPKNTPLTTDQAVDEQLLSELLAINPQLSPIQWLMDDRSELCVKLLLWQQLDILRRNLLSKQRDIAHKKINMLGNGEKSTLNIGYQFNEHDLSLLKPLAYTHPLSVEETQLLQVFSGLRRREMVVVTDDRPNSQMRNLRNDLLSLPYELEPLVWLRDNHLQYAALSTLNYLINQIMPSEIGMFSSSYSSRLESFSPKAVCHSKGIKFVLEKISYVRAAFSIRLAFRISDDQLKKLEKTRISSHHRYIEWRGVGNLYDDLENHYLICHSLLNSSAVDLPHRKHIDYHLRLDCYPTIVNRARKLSLRFDDMTLIAMKTPAANPVFYAVPFENLKWTVDIAALRRQFPGIY